MAVQTPPARPAGENGELSHRQIVTIIIGLMTGMFLAALDQNIVGTSIKTIADELKGLDKQAWVTTAYMITSTISTPIYGKLSDLYGRKKFFLAAITLFVLGSAACSFAGTMYELAAFRAFQGLGAGGLFSLALAIVGDIVPPRERAKYQGYFLAVFGTSSVIGPIVGGFFAQADSILGITGWRWVFLVNVPLGLIALAIVMATLHLHHTPGRARIDWAGASMLVVGLVPLLLVAEQGREWGWTSGASIACYLIGAVGIAGFVAVEARLGDDALLPLRIFKNRTIFIGLSGGFVIGAGMFGAMIVLPQYLQIVHGASPTMSGFQMLPMVLGMMIASVASGQLMSRTGKVRVFPIVGVSLMAAALVLLSRVGADTPMWQLVSMMFVFGFGLGNTMQPLTLAVQAAVNPREIGMATSAATFFRQIGGTLGVAVFLSVLFNGLGENIKKAFQDAAATPEFLAAMKRYATAPAGDVNGDFVRGLMAKDPGAVSKVSQDSSIIGRLDPVLAHPFKVGFSESIDLVFLLGAIVCAVGIVVLIFMPNVTLAGQSAAAARAAAEKAAAGDEPAGLRRHSITDDLVDAAAAEAGGHTLDELPDQDFQPSRS